MVSTSLLKDPLCSFSAIALCCVTGYLARRKENSRQAVDVSMYVSQLMHLQAVSYTAWMACLPQGSLLWCWYLQWMTHTVLNSYVLLLARFQVMKPANHEPSCKCGDAHEPNCWLLSLLLSFTCCIGKHTHKHSCCQCLMLCHSAELIQ